MTTTSRKRRFPELWGGIECTLNRVGDHYHSQLAMSGHLNRPEDLELIAELGIRTLRYPVLWEMVAPVRLDAPEWSWADERLGLLRRLGIDPVVGLLHHGSGPFYTSLVDPHFPAKLSAFARMVAQRYPWVKAFTPVNEPLTTARFSGLYGHWYPHGDNDQIFVQALLQQCRGVIEAMRAIREVIPDAQLVVTEDMGRTFSTELLSYQAEFENHRRWLSIDLLFGHVDKEHYFRPWLLERGVTEEELRYFQEHAVRPDVVGLNYYVTSDRYLDERLDLYPSSCHGGNNRHRYADVEAVRVCPRGIWGHEAVLRHAWLRYGTEVAFTEVHLGSSREQQLRWFQEAWRAGVKVAGEGVPVRAVTAWALLGSFDWNSLFTTVRGSYEPGAFDVRGPVPRPTALASAIREVACRGRFDHHTLCSGGWWRQPERFFPQCTPAPELQEPRCTFRTPRPVVVVGKSGTLGQAFGRICRQRDIDCRLVSRSEMDIASPSSVASLLDECRPWAVVNAAGFVRVDQAEAQADSCFRENTVGPAVLAAECARRGVLLVTFSSDMVFDGLKGAPYRESDTVAPLNVYGRSKAEAEWQVLQIYPQALVIRTSAFFGPWDSYNFVTLTLEALGRGEEVTAASDLVVSPTYVPDLVHTTLDLLCDGERGIWHVTNGGQVSWAELAQCCAKMSGVDDAAIICRPGVSFGFDAPRPPNSALCSERGVVLPTLEDALQRYLIEVSTAREER